MSTFLVEKLQAVQREIAAACSNFNREPGAVKLLVVSKNNPVSALQELYDCGVREFGENRLPELAGKYEALPKDILWHFIGPLQSNKVRKVVKIAGMIHSVSSLELLERVERISGEERVSPDFLLEVNVSGEASKGGFSPQELMAAAEVAVRCTHARCCGLMTMAPLGADSSQLTEIFSLLAALKAECCKRFDAVLPELSMGMSGDFPEAIACGATIVRIGSRIFK